MSALFIIRASKQLETDGKNDIPGFPAMLFYILLFPYGQFDPLICLQLNMPGMVLDDECEMPIIYHLYPFPNSKTV